MYEDSKAIILHIDCGMDSRIERVGASGHLWYDIDFPEVIEARKNYYAETETYKIQELHLPVYHALCAMLEEEFFD